MTRRGRRLRSPRWIAAIVVVLVAAAVTGLALAGGSPSITTRSQFVPGTPEGSTPVALDTTLYLPARTPAPAVLLAHGFGGTKASVAGEAQALARHGYVVLAYTARGFGLSGGLIHLDAPDYEVHDASLLVGYLANLPQVQKKGGAPQIAVAGSSYGGALALLLAGTDSRVKAVGADITWNDLGTALFPNGAGTGPGVFKKLWAGYLFASALGPAGTECGRFAPDVCAAYQRAAATGRPDAALLRLLQASSPATVLSRITAPTLLTQGEQDSLFPLSQADANARGLAATGTPVRVIWRLGGHDTGGGNAQGALIGWLDDVFAGRVHGRQPFRIDEPGAALSSEQGNAVSQSLQVAGYPGIDGDPRRTTTLRLSGVPQQVLAPAGGNPAAVTAVPLLGSLLGTAGRFGLSGQVSELPGQTATFLSDPLSRPMTIGGASSVRLQVTSTQGGDATLFAAVRDVGRDGTAVLPANLVEPVYLTRLRPGVPATVTVQLPSIVLDAARGHRLEVTVSTTDLAYQLPVDARTYTIALAGPGTLNVPLVTGTVHRSGTPAAWLVVGGAIAVAVLAGVGVVLARRRHAAVRDPELAAEPIVVSGLVKEYGDGYRAVDDVSFRVAAGQVVGLLGPNGAGKTTTLRVLVGLITPTAGAIHVFGEPVRPGASVLARVGAFIEGPGFLPHLTGLQNLQLYWAATGRPADEADFDTALEIAGLGASVERRVKTYSHGMKQRLGIAQAMLGLPELLVLDEPTNGLDPPQIAEMREVLRSYAATGRTVVVSSHLLAEVEQTCTHVVVMHRGQLVAAGSVAEVAGAGGVHLAVPDPERASAVLAAAGIAAEPVPARRALEDVFLDLVGDPNP
jgi:ABC-2 type transport system ATP-binding protein